MTSLANDLVSASVLQKASEAIEKTLVHWGVRGMRWGVRRTPAQLATARAAGYPPPKGGASAAASVAKSLSDEQLKSAIARMRLEQDYTRLVAEQTPAQRAKTDSYVKSLLKENGNRQVQRIARSAGDVAVEKAFGSLKKGGDFGPELSKALKNSRKK